MRVIIAEDDKVSRLRLEAAMKRAQQDVILAADGMEALRAFEAGTGPTLLLLDWAMPGLDGMAVCREIRQTTKAPAYIIFMTALSRHENLLEALEAGADDFVTKPFTIEALLARMRLGERVLRAAAPSEFLFEEALVDGLRSPGGVVITRDGGTVGRVFLHKSRVAWAQVSGEPNGIAHVIGPAASLSPDEIASVLGECRNTQRHFADVLVAWGLVGEDAMRARLRGFISERMSRMAQFRDARALFVPEHRPLTSSFSFALDEVFAAAAAAPRPLFSAAKQAPSDERATTLEVAGAIEGATSVCVIHAPSSAVLSVHLAAPEPDVLRAMLGLLHTARDSGANEISLTDRDAFHFLQRIPAMPDRCLYARLLRDSTLFGMARMQIGLVVARLGDAAVADDKAE